MNEDLKRIKKKYGEEMMHFCRENFPTLLETEGLLPSILESKFYPSHTLYEDLKLNNDFLPFINIVVDAKKKDKNSVEDTDKNAKELMKKAGYDLYECHNEEDIQSFKKYYKPGEELCTFRGGRLNSCIVFFAVKKNVDEIKRENFLNPERQDEYGTSVISIQFNKWTNYLSIKNRYNHTVENCDATFSNNLEKIIPGLTKAFEREYNIKIKQNNDKDFELSGYVVADDGRYYRENFEENNTVYTSNNIIIDNGEVKTYDKRIYTLFEYFVLDRKNKKLSLYDESLDDCLIEVIGEIDRIEEIKQDEERKITITNKKGEVSIIKLDKNNRIIEFTNNYVKNIDDDFLNSCTKLRKINIPNVEKIGDDFACNSQVEEFNAPNLKNVGSCFIPYNKSLRILETPSLEIVGNNFARNSQVEEFVAPNLREVGDYFMNSNESLIVLKTPSLEMIGFCFAPYSQVEEFINHKLKHAEEGFMEYNKSLRVLKIPSLEIVEAGFASNSQVEKFNASNLKKICGSFMSSNKSLKKLELPSLEIVGDDFASDSQVEEFNAPNLKSIGDWFMDNNKSLKILRLPSLEIAGYGFAYESQVEKFDAYYMKKVGNAFMKRNKSLKKLELPSLEIVGDDFACNSQVEEFSAPNLRVVGSGFMVNNKHLKRLNVPDDADLKISLLDEEISKGVSK